MHQALQCSLKKRTRTEGVLQCAIVDLTPTSGGEGFGTELLTHSIMVPLAEAPCLMEASTPGTTDTSHQ